MIDEYGGLRPISEEYIKLTSAKRKNRNARDDVWICETCVYYPPSSYGDKPCCMCDPEDPILNCYAEKEEA